MRNLQIKYADTLGKDIEERMRKGLIAYEKEQGIEINYKEFAFVLVDENNIAYGVLNAYTAFAEVYIEDIWVDKSVRGQGFGRKLIASLENHFRGKGYNNINLVTSAFQAPEFYKKCGFTQEFIRVNKTNPKLTKTFFVKFF